MDTINVPQFLYNGFCVKAIRSPILDTDDFNRVMNEIKLIYNIETIKEETFEIFPFSLYFLEFTSPYYYFIFDNIKGVNKIGSSVKIGMESIIKNTCTLIESIHNIEPSKTSVLTFRNYSNHTAPMLKNSTSTLNIIHKKKNIATPVFLAPYVFLELFKNAIDLFKSNMNIISRSYDEMIENTNDSGYLKAEKKQFDCNLRTVMNYYDLINERKNKIMVDANFKLEFLLYKNVVTYFTNE